MCKRLLALLVAPLLVLLPATAAAAVPPGKVWQVVAPGDTLESIARENGLTAADLARWNQLEPPYAVRVDATLRLDPPPEPLPPWRTTVQPVTAAMVNWRPGCPVPPRSLRRVWVSYIDLRGGHHDGSIIVRADVVTRVQRIFETLYRWRFRIMAMSPVPADLPGRTGMSVVTAGYSCRTVSGTDVWSEHAYGVAIDINPLQNPMIRGTSVSPAAGRAYLTRTSYRIGMIHAEGAAQAFTANGYFWGGQWRSLKDFMHFSLTDR